AVLRFIARARGADERAVGVVTNGRRFAYRAFTITAARAGLRAASVKIFAADPQIADAIAREDGAHDQALAGLRELAAVGVVTFELRIPLHALALATLPAQAELAARVRAAGIRVEASLDAIGLENLGQAAERLGQLEARCAALGVA